MRALKFAAPKRIKAYSLTAHYRIPRNSVPEGALNDKFFDGSTVAGRHLQLAGYYDRAIVAWF